MASLGSRVVAGSRGIELEEAFDLVKEESQGAPIDEIHMHCAILISNDCMLIACW